MSGIVELSNGYVFASDSVRVVTPVRKAEGREVCNTFLVVGVGYKVKIYSHDHPNLKQTAEFEDLQREAVAKLLGEIDG